LINGPLYIACNLFFMFTEKQDLKVDIGREGLLTKPQQTQTWWISRYVESKLSLGSYQQVVEIYHLGPCSLWKIVYLVI
jgi:hypothetical protein